ncbi:hypothetical protein IHE45_15G057400 [Dioscorea alata]|uniref:Uncharacterized protein n=1 Tax=Dioscorea alata TaxID=55571 RepID=A0ACB7ULM2_DIOAL|nr:hypothetical protein IHE45_15G057400 [Dioscorea alata]
MEVQNDHQSVELLQGQGAEEVRVEIQDGHQSDSVSDDSDIPWIEGVTKRLNEYREKKRGRWFCTIFMVPEDVRRCDMNAYDPSIVTIGPYHYPKLKERITLQAMQDHKWDCIWRLVSRRTKRSCEAATDLLSTCLKAMKCIDADVRECYSEDLGMTPHELALIMLLDGCFIIHVLLNFNGDLLKDMYNRVMLGINNDDNKDDQQEEDIAAGHKEDMVEFDLEEIDIDMQVTRGRKVWDTMLLDLVKVENQIPFFIIKTLFDKLKTSGDEDINLVEIADKLLRSLLPSYGSFSTFRPPLPEIDEVDHLLELFHSTLVPSTDCLDTDSSNLEKQKKDVEWIPSVTELQLAGVKFVEKKNAGSVLDISFKNDTIEIPQVRLHGATITLFRNLIVFEQCDYLDTEDNYVTAYASFMDYMINTSKDVELFELKGIFNNQLGTPDHAATFINQLCHHTQDRGFRHDYFKNPWTIASLLAAFILLLLTVEQSFFAAYSYFRPPS